MLRTAIPLLSLVGFAPVMLGQVTLHTVVRSTLTVQANQAGNAVPAASSLLAGEPAPTDLRLLADCGGAHVGWACTTLSLPDGALGIESQVTAAVDALRTPGNGAATSHGSLAVSLSAPRPLRGRLCLFVQCRPSGGDPGAGNFAVDVFDDGNVDLVGDYSGATLARREWALTLGPQPITIRLDHQGQVASGSQPGQVGIGEYEAMVRLLFLPDAYEVVDATAGCVTVAHTRRLDGRIELVPLGNGAPPSPTLSMLLFGDSPHNGPAPVPPCPLLLLPIEFVAFFGPLGPRPVVLPLAPLPLGSTIYAQTAYLSLGSTAASTSQLLAIR